MALDLVEGGMRPVLVGFGFAPCALGAIPSECDLRLDYYQGQADYSREREPLSEQDHAVKEREIPTGESSRGDRGGCFGG